MESRVAYDSHVFGARRTASHGQQCVASGEAGRRSQAQLVPLGAIAPGAGGFMALGLPVICENGAPEPHLEADQSAGISLVSLEFGLGLGLPPPCRS